MNSEGTVSTSELSTSAILERLKLRDYKIWHRVTFNSINLPNFMKNPPICSKVIGEGV